MTIADIFLRHDGSVQALARKFSADDADDIAASTYAELLHVLDNFRNESELRSFVLGVCANIARRSLRAAARRRVVHDRFAAEENSLCSEDPESAAMRSEVARSVASALEALPPPQRAAIVLVCIEGMSTADAAKACGTSDSNIRIRLFRARRQLRVALAHQYESQVPVQRVSVAMVLTLVAVTVVGGIAWAAVTASGPFRRTAWPTFSQTSPISSHKSTHLKDRAGPTTVSPQASSPTPQTLTPIDPPQVRPSAVLHLVPARADSNALVQRAQSDLTPPVDSPTVPDHIGSSSSVAVNRVAAATIETDADYALAHRLHFELHDYRAAFIAWDRYLANHPHGAFALEARYNRAVTLVRLGQFEDASAALIPFADGTHGRYRSAEARALLRAIAERINPEP